MKEFLKRGKCLIFFAFLLYIINSMATISAPLYLSKLVDFFKGKKIGLNSIITNGTWFLGLYALLMVTQIASSVLLAVINKKARIHYQSLILDKILKLPYLQQIKYRTAYLQSRWVEDSLNISSLFGENLFGLMKNILTILFGIGIAFWLSLKFSIMILVFIALIGTGLILVSKYLTKKFKKYIEDFSNLSGNVNETITGIVELKVMGFLKIFEKNIKEKIKAISGSFLSIQIKGLLLLSFITILLYGGFLGILMYLGFLLTSEKMSIGASIGYIAIIFIIIKSLSGLTNQINGLNRVFASLERTSELIAMEEDLPYQEGKEIERIESIEVNDLWFRYHIDQEYLIKGFSHKFEKGKVYAITGKSGVGKSTLLKIILGIIPANHGEIYVNGKRLKKEDIACFWKRIGYLSQEPFLFKGKLTENLYPFNDKLDEGKLAKALQMAGISFNGSLSGGVIEEGGKNLSGGEKRRLSLARAFIKEPDVLILDEPTSQIDKETEELILESIHSFARNGKIVILIAHSSKASEIADEIIEMD